MLQRFFCLLIGYLLGCILTAEILSYAKSHQSIRTMGSGNPGMTNALRLYGKKYGLLVLWGDLFKTAIACLSASLFFPLLSPLCILYAGLGSILGHNFPFWNGFRGGKGVACTCMTLFCFSPLWGIISCLLGLLACLISRYLAIGGTLIPAIFFIFILFITPDQEVHLLCFFIFLLMLQRSKDALKRILHHQEKKGLWISPTNKKKE